MKKYIFIVMSVGLVMACSKTTPMKGPLEKFVGTWAWHYTYWPHQGSSEVDTIYATDQPYQYLIKITGKGEMYWYKDGVEIKKIDMKITGQSCEDSDCHCYIYLAESPILSTIIYSDCGSGGEHLVFYNVDFPYDYSGSENTVFLRVE